MRAWIGAVLVALGAWAAPAAAQTPSLPSKPGVGEHVHDHAEMLDAGTEARILAMCAALLAERGVELQVVTIESMDAYGGGTIERAWRS